MDKPQQTYRIAIWLWCVLKAKQHIFERGRPRIYYVICLGQRAQRATNQMCENDICCCVFITYTEREKKICSHTLHIGVYLLRVAIELRKCYQIEKTCQIDVIRFNWHCFG